MANGPPPSREEKARQKAAEANISLAKAQAMQRFAAAGADWEAATHQLLFTKAFNTFLEAVMRDSLETVGMRFLAWLQRYSWGAYALYAIGEDGLPKYQVDCCRELGIDKSRLSHVVAYYESRGYVRCDGKKLVLVISPLLAGAPERETRSKEFEAFVGNWKVAHSTEFEEMEAARSVVSRIRKVMLADYKKSQAEKNKAAASLLREQDSYQNPAGSPPTPFESDMKRVAAKRRANPDPEVAEQQSKAQAEADIRKFLIAEIRRMQVAYPNSQFSQVAVDEANPDHQNLIDLILKKLGTIDEEIVAGYILHIVGHFRGWGKGGVKGVERSPHNRSGPKTLGLLVSWAEDYARVAGTHSSGASGDD